MVGGDRQILFVEVVDDPDGEIGAFDVVDHVDAFGVGVIDVADIDGVGLSVGFPDG